MIESKRPKNETNRRWRELQRNKLVGRIAEAGYTQGSLAQAMKMSKNSLNSKINGKSQFNLKEIEQMCEILSINSLEEKAQIFSGESSQ